MHSCDMANYQFTGSLPLPTGIKGGVASPIRWGEDGFAYIAGDQVVIFRQKLNRILPRVDLTVERSELPRTLPRNNQLTYRLTVTNRSPQPATSVHLTGRFPAGSGRADDESESGERHCRR